MIETLKKAYTKSGLSLKKLSELSGVCYASVHATFTGDRDPQLSTVQKLSRVLGLELTVSKRKGKG